MLHNESLSQHHDSRQGKREEKQRLSDVVVPTWNPSPQKVEAEVSGVLGQPRPRIKRLWAV